jgi:nucleoid-associated protein YgaU
MPHDARLGLVAGVTLVILVAVLFIRKDGATGRPAGAPSSVTPISYTTDSGVPAPGVVGMPAQPAPAMPVAPRWHRVQEGESLMSIAVRYYGDAGQVSFLYRANRDRILGPHRVPVGTVLLIPELPAELAGRVSR